MSQLTDKQKYEIVFRKDINNESLRSISTTMDINRASATKWYKQYTISGNFNRAEGSGRKKKLSQLKKLKK
jgi:hypothetical protein